MKLETMITFLSNDKYSGTHPSNNNSSNSMNFPQQIGPRDESKACQQTRINSPMHLSAANGRCQLIGSNKSVGYDEIGLDSLDSADCCPEAKVCLCFCWYRNQHLMSSVRVHKC